MHAHILELCFTNATFIISHQTSFLSCWCSYALAFVLASLSSSEESICYYCNSSRKTELSMNFKFQPKFTFHKDESICKTSLKAPLTSEAICWNSQVFFVMVQYSTSLQISLSGISEARKAEEAKCFKFFYVRISGITLLLSCHYIIKITIRTLLWGYSSTHNSSEIPFLKVVN